MMRWFSRWNKPKGFGSDTFPLDEWASYRPLNLSELGSGGHLIQLDEKGRIVWADDSIVPQWARVLMAEKFQAAQKAMETFINLGTNGEVQEWPQFCDFCLGDSADRGRDFDFRQPPPHEDDCPFVVWQKLNAPHGTEETP